MAEVEPEALSPPASPTSEKGSKDFTTSESSETRTASGSTQSALAITEPYDPDTFPSNLPTPPFVDVQGIPNFRDLGGYACHPPSDSALDPSKRYILRTGLLYRSAHPTQLTPTGCKVFKDKLGIRDVYDLRSAPEISRLAHSIASDPDSNPLALANGTLSVPGVTRHFTPVYEEEDYSPTNLATKLKWYTAGPSPGKEYSEGFVNAYRDIATHGATNYAKIFRQIVTRPKDPLLFHCTAGKDRTGVFGALIMDLIGVDREIICWEYAITEPGLGVWRDAFIERITRSGLGGGGNVPKSQPQSNSGQGPAKLAGTTALVTSKVEAERICGSRAVNMRAWLKLVLDDELGGVLNYLDKNCGLSQEEIQTLRQNLVVELPSGTKPLEPVNIEGWTLDRGMLKDMQNQPGNEE